MAAGCSMADMADPEDVYACWEELDEVYGDRRDADGGPVIPVTYMNSPRRSRRFVGKHGGIVCTSTNAKTVLEWAFERGEARALLPRPAPRPQHRRTPWACRSTQMLLWNPRRALGGKTARELERARVILWQGHCSCTSASPSTRSPQARASTPA